jgi:hypothetical protein
MPAGVRVHAQDCIKEHRDYFQVADDTDTYRTLVLRFPEAAIRNPQRTDRNCGARFMIKQISHFTVFEGARVDEASY